GQGQSNEKGASFGTPLLFGAGFYGCRRSRHLPTHHLSSQRKLGTNSPSCAAVDWVPGQARDDSRRGWIDSALHIVSPPTSSPRRRDPAPQPLLPRPSSRRKSGSTAQD